MLTASVFFTPNFPSAAIASEWPSAAAYMRAVMPYCEDARRGETGRRETEGSSELRDKKSTTGGRGTTMRGNL